MTLYALLLAVALPQTYLRSMFDSSAPFHHYYLVTGPAQLLIFIIWSVMHNILVICIAAFDRSSPNLCSNFEDYFPLDYIEIEQNAVCYLTTKD